MNKENKDKLGEFIQIVLIAIIIAITFFTVKNVYAVDDTMFNDGKCQSCGYELERVQVIHDSKHSQNLDDNYIYYQCPKCKKIIKITVDK